jgi:hypothetical protein
MIPHHHFSSESGAIQMRFQRLLFAAIVACGVSACAKDVVGVTHTPPPLAYVRYINAVPDTFNMDFRAVDQVTFSQPFVNTQFRGLGVGNYQGYQAGSRHIRLFLDPNPSSGAVAVDPTVVSTVMVDTTFTFTAGSYYTLVHYGNARAPSTQKLWIIADALPAQSATNFQYRVVNATSVVGSVDVFATADTSTALVAGSATIAGVAKQTASAYQSVATTTGTGSFFLRVTTPGTTTQVGGAKGYKVQAGTPGTTLADPIYGSAIAGSVFTAVLFDAVPANSIDGLLPAPSNAPFLVPAVVFFPDLQPPRTTTP